MDLALAKAESLGANVTYNAPLMTLDELIKEGGAPEFGPLECESILCNFISFLT